MKRRLIGLIVALAALALWVAPAPTYAQLPTGPKTAVKSTFHVENPPPEFDVVQSVVDFAPGAWTTPHFHGGAAFITVAKGEMTYRSNGTDKTYKTGETWVEKPGDPMQIGNAAGSPARTLVTFLLPKGAQLTTQQQIPGVQAPLVQPTKMATKFSGQSLGGPFDLIEVQQDFPPGAITPVHTHGGPAYITVIAGELTLEQDGAAKEYSAGESWTETPGQFMQVANRGTAPASTFVTFLLPKGAQLTTSQHPDAPSANSPAGTVQQEASLTKTSSMPIWLLPLLIVILLIVIGGGAFLVRRRFAHR